MTLRLDPAERFLLLAQLLDDVVAPTPETVRAVALASMTALRFTQGRATAVEAIFAVERARAALYDASVSNAEPRARGPAVVTGADGRKGKGSGGPSGRRLSQEQAAGQSTAGSASAPNPRTRRICVSLSVDVDRFADAYMRKHYRDVLRIDGRVVEVPGELRQLCAEYRSRGFEVFPPCDRAHPTTGLCQGHEGDHA